MLALETIGGAAQVEEAGDKIFITSERCPLTAAVAQHPEVCKLAETLLTEIIGSNVKEECDRDGRPKCRFRVS